MLQEFPTIQTIAQELADTELGIPDREKRTAGAGALLWNRPSGQFAMRFTEVDSLWFLEIADETRHESASAVAIRKLADAGILEWCERAIPAEYSYRRSFDIRKGR